MKYELAKELKDNDFPKSFTVCDGTNCNMQGEPHFWNEPTLEELIEACGESFVYLMRYDGEQGDGIHWRAAGKDESYEDNYIHTYGSTPTETVALLWLALNKKQYENNKITL